MARNREEQTELDLLREIAGSLRDILAWTKRLAYPSVKQTLETVLDSPEKRRRLGNAGRERAVNVFSWEAVAAQTVRVYERAIARRVDADGEAQC